MKPVRFCVGSGGGWIHTITYKHSRTHAHTHARTRKHTNTQTQAHRSLPRGQGTPTPTASPPPPPPPPFPALAETLPSSRGLPQPRRRLCSRPPAGERERAGLVLLRQPQESSRIPPPSRRPVQQSRGLVGGRRRGIPAAAALLRSLPRRAHPDRRGRGRANQQASERAREMDGGGEMDR